jgi:hypothetical protein
MTIALLPRGQGLIHTWPAIRLQATTSAKASEVSRFIAPLALPDIAPLGVPARVAPPGCPAATPRHAIHHAAASVATHG